MWLQVEYDYSIEVTTGLGNIDVMSSLLLLLLLSRFSRAWLCATPIDGSLSGSTVPGILQERTLEWVAISFSNAWKWKVKVKSLSHIWLSATPWTAAHQSSLIRANSMVELKEHKLYYNG